MNTNIKIQTTDKQLSAHGGLHIFAKCWQKFGLPAQISKFLPGVRRSQKKFEDLALGFAAGAECLDDMATYAKDEGFLAVCNEKVLTPKSYGDFLREFTSLEIDDGNRALARSAFLQRAAVDKNMTSITLDFDSTSNRQYAEKMEGVCFSGEKKYECLTTMYVFDELGNQYYSDVRPGNTHTSDSISKIIRLIMSQMPKAGAYQTEEFQLPWLKLPYKKNFRVYARADAGYCNNEFMNACSASNIGFVVRMHENMLNTVVHTINNWKNVNRRTKKQKRRDGRIDHIDNSIRFYDGRSAEIGTTLYQNPNMMHAGRVVCIRAKKPGTLGIREDDFDYFAWLTNIGEHEMNNEKIIFFYRGRGHAENYIREMKNGYDMHHYPCLKLNANRAYALIAAFAHNILRLISLQKSRKKPQFAKAIRNKFINLPCQVVRRGGQVFFRFMDNIAKEVEVFLNQLQNLQHGFT